MSWTRGYTSALLACALLMAAASSSAEPAEVQDDLERAEALFTAGADYPQALELFRESYVRTHAWRALNGTALCLERLGNHVEALEAYERLLAKHAEELGPKRVERVRARIRNQSARVGRIELKLEQHGVRVSIDGEEVMRSPGELGLWLMPGAHAVEATGDGLVPFSATLRLEPGERERLNLRLAASPTASAAAPRAAEVPDSPALPPAQQDQGQGAAVSPWISWSLVGGGTLFALAGAGLLLQASADFQAFDDSVTRVADGAPRVNSGDQSLKSRAELEQTLGVVSFVVAGSALATGIVLLLWDDSSTEVGVTHQGVWARGRF